MKKRKKRTLRASPEPDIATAEMASKNADQVEFCAMQDGMAPLERALWDDQLSEHLQEDYPTIGQELEEFEERQFQLDSAVTEMSDELDRRERILRQAYPFRIENGSVCYTPSSTLVYEYCLAVTQADDITSNPYYNLPRAFERLSAHVLKLWLGLDTAWYRSGWPPDRDRPVTFRKMVEDLHDCCGEWWWGERDERYAEPKEVKDGGVDVVVWKHPPDSRVGGLFLLGQCACGNDWDTKLRDLDPRLIEKKFVRDISVAEELLFFATPFHVPHSKKWEDAQLEAQGILFDRARVALIAEAKKNQRRIGKWARKPYLELIRLVLPDFAPDAYLEPS